MLRARVARSILSTIAKSIDEAAQILEARPAVAALMMLQSGERSGNGLAMKTFHRWNHL
jgi:hypothetical protein